MSKPRPERRAASTDDVQPGLALMRMRRRLAVVLLAGASVLVVSLLSGTRLFRLLDLKASDLQFLIRGKQVPARIVLLMVDQKALDRLPDPLIFWHPYYAEAIRAAARGRARVFGLDVYFALPVEKWEKDYDRILAEAVMETAPRMPVVCGFTPGVVDSQKQSRVPLYLYASAMGLTASLHLWEDPDSFIRREPLLEQVNGPANGLIRSFPLRIAEKFLGREARLQAGQLYLGDTWIPRDQDGAMIINYAGPTGTFPRISLIDFLEAARSSDEARLRRWVEGRIVLLGFNNMAFGDRHATPFYLRNPSLPESTPGIEVHANVLETLLAEKFLREPAPWVSLCGLWLLAAFSAGLGCGWRPGRAVALVGVISAGSILLTNWLFRLGILVSWFQTVLVVILAGLAAVIYQVENRRRFLHRAFSMFVGRGYAKDLEKTGKIAAATGTRRQVTVLFSDIRDFTAYCEEKQPIVVLKSLAQYLSAMTEVVVRHGGEVNKFMGDGIMAIFSDQDTGTVSGDHAQRAVRCGLEMVQAYNGFRTQVGIHTGDAVVGTIGSSEKLEHTVLGMTVNLASRLEQLNKQHSTQLLLSKDTQSLLDGSIPMTDLGSVEIRGKSEAMQVFTPTVLLPDHAAKGPRGACLALLLLLLTARTPVAGQATEEPVGVLLAASSNAQVWHSRARAAVQIHVGDLLFSGDRLLAGDSPATWLYCPARSSQTADPRSEAVFQPGGVKMAKGKITGQTPVGACMLPRVVRLSHAGQQRLGGLTMREVRGPVKLVSPAGGAVLDERPSFLWGAAEGADAYDLLVAESSGVVIWKTRLNRTELRYPPEAPRLTSGKRFFWRITALRADRSIGTAESEFEVVPAAEGQRIRQDLAEIDALRATNDPILKLARATRLERARMISSALDEYGQLAALWKDAAWLQIKVKQLQDRVDAAQRTVNN